MRPFSLSIVLTIAFTAGNIKPYLIVSNFLVPLLLEKVLKRRSHCLWINITCSCPLQHFCTLISFFQFAVKKFTCMHSHCVWYLKVHEIWPALSLYLRGYWNKSCTVVFDNLQNPSVWNWSWGSCHCVFAVCVDFDCAAEFH
jgi:hypothetical protein